MNEENELLDRLTEEANCFDDQILERTANGHIPDLRHKERCEWFYNNVWRDPVYTDLLYGEIVRQIITALKKHHSKPLSDIEILEVACGPGHIALELSRNSCNVTGIDISPACIDIARKTANEDPFQKTRGRLNYVNGNFMELDWDSQYDMVLFSCSLHHFKDLDATLKKSDELLLPNGLFFTSEPTRYQLRYSEATLIHLIRGLLSLGGNYYEDIPIPADETKLKKSIQNVQREFGYVNEKGSKIQSPMDNESTYSEMHPALMKYFTKLEIENDFCFFDRIIGGIRLGSIEQERLLARWIWNVDNILSKDRMLRAEQFHFIGRKNTDQTQ